MKKSIYYWSPCLGPIGTVKSTVNSAIAASTYGKIKYQVYIINSCGEWDDYKHLFESHNIKIINFKYKFFHKLPKRGFLKSRFSYFLIYILCFFPLLNLLKNSRPDFLISHLITSLPLTIVQLFKFKTKFILRISGMPKLNFLRKIFWKFANKKLHIITCPTKELKLKLSKSEIFSKNKIHLLSDAIIDIKKFNQDKRETVKNFEKFDKKRLIFAAGRLTKQKNFSYLIEEFIRFSKKNDDFILIILGEGELRKNLEKLIIQKGAYNKVYLYGYVKNIYKYFSKGEVFILSSLWEEVGFVMVEAALSNLFIISSNCPNGPSEFLNNGKNGILYENNKLGELEKSLDLFCSFKNTNKDKFEIKRNIFPFTKFRHYLALNRILSLNN